MQILPFAVLLGGILCFWRLTRSSELIVARAAGVSAWEFLAAPDALRVAVRRASPRPRSARSPRSCWRRAEALDNTYLRTGGGPLALNGGQLWLRQSDRALTPQGVAIIHAHRRAPAGQAADRAGGQRVPAGWRRPAARADRGDARDAGRRQLAAGGRAHASGRTSCRSRHARSALPTDLTVARVQESFASPDTLSVWALPDFIALLDRSGFSSIRHRLHFQALLALPLLAATMALVSAGFSMRPARRGGVAQMIGSGVAAGFALFVVSKIAEEFGQSGALPVALAAWAPAAVRAYAGGRPVAAHGRRLRMDRCTVLATGTRRSAARPRCAGEAAGLLLVGRAMRTARAR